METKYVEIRLSVLTRVEYTEVLEVPENLDQNELENLADQRYHDVDAGSFCDDPDYWERGSTQIHVIDASELQSNEVVQKVQKVASEFIVK